MSLFREMAAMSVSGVPHRPNPLDSTTEPDLMSRTASSALATTLDTARRALLVDRVLYDGGVSASARPPAEHEAHAERRSGCDVRDSMTSRRADNGQARRQKRASD